MAIFTTLSVVIWFSTGTLGIFATLVYVFTMRVVINDILSMAIISTLSTSILFCNLCYILNFTYFSLILTTHDFLEICPLICSNNYSFWKETRLERFYRAFNSLYDTVVIF